MSEEPATEGPSFQVHITDYTGPRHCGECQLCCRLLPVNSLNKGAGVKCKHQRFAKGCAVYADLMRVAPECRIWSCRWLVNDGCDDMRRPDRSHYVIDMLPDFITVDDPEYGRSQIEVAQIWIDPKYPDAHRDPALRAWLEKRDLVGLCRFPDHSAITLFPPSRMRDRQWLEKHSQLTNEAPHSFAQVVTVLSAGN